MKTETRSQWLASIKAANDEADAKAAKKREDRHRKKAERKAANAAAKAKPKKFKTPDYATYIKSAAWKKKRLEAFRHYGRRCQVCKRRYRPEVHHKTYVRLGREQLDDLEVLCTDCHADKHPQFSENDELSRRFRAMVASF